MVLFLGTQAMKFMKAPLLPELISDRSPETIDRIRVLEHSTFARLRGRVRATTRRIYLRVSGAEFLTVERCCFASVLSM